MITILCSASLEAINVQNCVVTYKCVLSFAALVVYCTKSRRAERYWQKTLLQMEEMESQIREEIRKGVFTHERTHAQTTAHAHHSLLCFRSQMMFGVH